MTTLYTADHEWIRIEGDVATIGVTDYAQSQLGDVVFVELPKVGRTLKKAEAAAVVESVKAAFRDTMRRRRARSLRSTLSSPASPRWSIPTPLTRPGFSS